MQDFLRSLSLCVAVLAGAEQAQAQSALKLETVTDGLSYPWAVAFLPGGDYLVTERDGVLKHVAADGTQSAVSGTPEVFAQGQGGLLDVALDPDFATNGDVFLSFSQGSPGGAGTSVFRATFDESAEGYALANGKVIFAGNNRSFGGRHFGSRLVFAPDGNLFVTTGDRGDGPRAQDANDHSGAVLRIDRDGKPAPGNPFLGQDGYQPEIWSIGHRNPQGAALNPATGELWTVEHGARGGDEINIPQAGRNYGWPVISYGRHYSGAKIGEGSVKDGLEQPVHYWDPSIAPSGMAFVTSARYPEWAGNVLVGALRGRHLARLTLAGENIASEQRHLADLGARIRDVRQGPDGFLYVLTDSDDGSLIRLVPNND